jgi:CD109 antigen
VVASGKDGTLGSAIAPLPVFQDFFVEPDVPKQLTQNDETLIPISVFNYLNQPQQIELTVSGEDWFQTPTQTQTVFVGAGDVTGIQIPIKVTQFGEFNFTVTAKGDKMSDAVQKPVRVAVDGRKVSDIAIGTLAKVSQATIALPAQRITGSERVEVSVSPANVAGFTLALPESFYQDICFYSDVGAIHPIALQMAYLKQANQLAPEQQLRGERLLQMGYQRLLRYFDYGKGGFTGDCHFLLKGQANVGASANALVALTDMQKLIYVDPLIIERTIGFLSSSQLPDGSWQIENDSSYFYFCGPPPAPRDDRLSLTTHIAWALAEAGLSNSAPVQNALGYIKSRLADINDAHTLALVANTLLLSGNDDAVANRILSVLIRRSTLADGERSWDVSYYNNLDTTATATLALVRGNKPDEAQQALAGLRRYLGAERQYYLSQPARPTALRALLLDAQQRPTSGQANVAVQLNQAAANDLRLNLSDVSAQNVLLSVAQLKTGDNALQLKVDGDAVLRYRVHNEYYVPWQSANATTGGPFAFEVSYANKEVKLNDAVQVVATLINQTKDKTAPVIVELGVPAGYYPAYEDWQQLQDTGVVRGYQVEGTKIIVNLDGLDAGAKIELPYRLIANIPGSVRVPPSKVYQAITASDAVEAGTGEVLVVK